MSKTKRIEQLEQRVAELMGEVERLKAEMRTMPRWGEMPRVPQQPYVPTWTGPDTIGPYDVTSGAVDPSWKWERFEEWLMIEQRRTPPYVPTWTPENEKINTNATSF